MSEDSVKDLMFQLKEIDFNKAAQIILKKKIGGISVNSLDFLLDWKYEIVKVLCTHKSEILDNGELVNKFEHFDFERNRAELMKALENLKVAEKTQKIILDDFVKQKGFESLNLELFEQVEEKYGNQANNRDENKTIFLLVSNDFIKLCKVIWRIIKNTNTEYKNNFVKYKNDMYSLEYHMNFVFQSDTNKNFFAALQSFSNNHHKKLRNEKSKLQNRSQKAFDYSYKNGIFAYFRALSRIKCIDAEYTEFANRLDPPQSNRKVVILTTWKQIYADGVPVDRIRYDNKIIIAESEKEENNTRETRGQKIKKFALDLLNSLVKKWYNLSHKTKKIISGSFVFVFFVFWTLALLNISEIAVFMSLALSWTIAIISFVGMMGFACIFALLITNDSENVQKNLSSQNDLEIQSYLNLNSIGKQQQNDIHLNGTEHESDLSSDLKK